MNRRTFLARTGIATVIALLAGKVVLKTEVPAVDASETVTGRMTASGTMTGRIWDPHTLVAADMYNVKPHNVTTEQSKTAKRLTMMHMYGSSPDNPRVLDDVKKIVNYDMKKAERIVLNYYANPPVPLPGHLRHLNKYKGRSV